MALGQHGKRRLGTFGGKKPSQHNVSGPTPAVGGPRPDRTASWPGNPGKENTAPGAKHGLPLVKTFIAGSYMPGNPHGGRGPSKHKAKEMLKHGEVGGKKLSKKQKGLFGVIASGKKPTRMR